MIDRQRVMQAQPSVAHQAIAGNVERLLNDAMEAEGDRIAVRATTIDMSDGPGGSYVPDATFLDADEEGMTRSVSTGYHAPPAPGAGPATRSCPGRPEQSK